MSFESPLRVDTYITAADLSGNQFYCVKDNGAGAIVLAGAGDKAVGVLQNKPSSGRAAAVMTAGISKTVAGAAVAAGDFLMVDGTGRVVTATGTNAVIGQAREAAGAAGVVIAVNLLPHAGKL